MNEKLSLQIPTPCHENWNAMTTTQQGRFCSSCSKQVVDFSLMTDQQVLNYFKKVNGRICGRFANDQLQRPLQPTAIESKKSWWIALLMPLLLLFDKAGAQRRNTTKGKPVISRKDGVLVTVGMIAPRIIPELTIIPPTVTINGKVVDEDGKPLAWATVRHTTSNRYSTTDSTGNFTIQVKNYSTALDLEVSSIGYETAYQLAKESDSSVIITLKSKVTELDPVSVASYETTHFNGGIYIITKVSRREKLDTTWRKIARNTAFKIYPNPVIRGAAIKIDFKEAGTYSIQIVSNNGSILTVKEATIQKGSTATSVIVPSGAAQGLYYVRVIDEQKKKQYTDKILVQ